MQFFFPVKGVPGYKKTEKHYFSWSLAEHHMEHSLLFTELAWEY